MLERLKSCRIPALAALVLAIAIGSVFVVKQYEPKQWQAEQATKNRGEIDAVNILASERVAYYTKILAIFTGALSAFGVIQVWFLIRADQKAALAADLAGKQMALSGRQTDLAEKQHGLGREQFFATHRPRLVLKDVFFDEDNLVFELVNIGGSDAKIVGGFVVLAFVSDERRFKDAREGNRQGLDGAVFSAGQLRQFKGDVPAAIRDQLTRMATLAHFPDAARIRNADNPAPPMQDIYFFGAIQYVDGRGEEFGVTRLSAFRRLYVIDGPLGGFKRTGNPDHEYAD